MAPPPGYRRQSARRSFMNPRYSLMRKRRTFSTATMVRGLVCPRPGWSAADPVRRLLDHLIRPQQQRRRQRQAEGLGGLEVDAEPKLGGLLHRQIGRHRSLENLVDIGCRAAKQIRHVNAV